MKRKKLDIVYHRTTQGAQVITPHVIVAAQECDASPHRSRSEREVTHLEPFRPFRFVGNLQSLSPSERFDDHGAIARVGPVC